MELSNLRPAEGSKHSDNFRRGRGHGSGTAKLLVKDIKDSLLVPDIRNRDSREVRCLYTDVFLREVSLTETLKKLSQSMQTFSIVFEDGAEVTVDSLLASGAISKIADGVKILGNGELTKKLNVKVNAVSETAKSKIELLVVQQR